jgi:hypothetical protein
MDAFTTLVWLEARADSSILSTEATDGNVFGVGGPIPERGDRNGDVPVLAGLFSLSGRPDKLLGYAFDDTQDDLSDNSATGGSSPSGAKPTSAAVLA